LIVFNKIEYLILINRVDITEDGLKALVHLSYGDMRRSLNIMQSTHLAFNKVNEENVYMCVGHPSKNDMISVINWLLNDDFTTIYNRRFPIY